MTNTQPGLIERKFPKMYRLLRTQAEIRHLLKATVPLWLITVVACGAGFVTIIHDRQESCRSGRGDIVEFVNRITAQDETPPTPAERASLDKLLHDFVSDCG